MATEAGDVRRRCAGGAAGAERLPRSDRWSHEPEIELPGVTIRTILRDLAESRSLDLEAPGRRRGPRPPDHHSAHAEDRTRAVGIRRLPARRTRARVRRERDPLSREPRPRRTGRASSSGSWATRCRACSSPTASTRQPKCSIEADRAQVPLLRTRAATPEAMSRLSAVLDTYLSARGIIHGVLLDILGLGVLVVGESGIGKSECALDLVVRGHRLVADDAVELRCRAQSFVLGTLPRADPPPHGDPRARHDQRPGHVRRRLDADVEAGRARRAAGAMGARPRVRSPRRRRQLLRAARHPHPDGADAGGARAERRDPRRGRGAQPAAARRAGTTPPAGSSSASTASSSSGSTRCGRRVGEDL